MNISAEDVAEWADLLGHVPEAAIGAWLAKYGDADSAVLRAAAVSPAVYALFAREGELHGVEKDVVATFAGTAWSRSADTVLNRDEWRELFELAGYQEDGYAADRPEDALTLWRGSVPDLCDHWSWTENRDAAVLYASEFGGHPELGIVWRATVEPDRLLAKLNHGLYAEHIVDTDGPLIKPDGLWCRCDVDLSRFAVEHCQRELDLHELVECKRR